MSAFYTYHVVFISPDTKETHVLLEDGRVFPNDLKLRSVALAQPAVLNRVLWERWRDEVSRDDITTFVHGVHNDSSDFGWIWSKPRAELVRVF